MKTLAAFTVILACVTGFAETNAPHGWLRSDLIGYTYSIQSGTNNYRHIFTAGDFCEIRKWPPPSPREGNFFGRWYIALDGKLIITDGKQWVWNGPPRDTNTNGIPVFTPEGKTNTIYGAHVCETWVSRTMRGNVVEVSDGSTTRMFTREQRKPRQSANHVPEDTARDKLADPQH